MKLKESNYLVIAISSHFLYLSLANTSSLHNLPIPSIQIWTIPLLGILGWLGYQQMREPATKFEYRMLYFAVILSIAASLLRIFGFSLIVLSYATIILLIAVFTAISLIDFVLEEKNTLLTIYFVLILLQLFILFGRSFTEIQEYVNPWVGPIFELVLIVGIIYYNYKLLHRADELFIIIISTILGYELAGFVLTKDVPPLIISSMIDQLFSLSQYNLEFIQALNTDFFFKLHMAEIFNLVAVILVRNRSMSVVAILITGFDFTYPPMAGFRALALLLFFKKLNRENIVIPEVEEPMAVAGEEKANPEIN